MPSIKLITELNRVFNFFIYKNQIKPDQAFKDLYDYIDKTHKELYVEYSQLNDKFIIWDEKIKSLLAIRYNHYKEKFSIKELNTADQFKNKYYIRFKFDYKNRYISRKTWKMLELKENHETSKY